jgi:multiple sugar transport system substrate-binding protein
MPGTVRTARNDRKDGLSRRRLLGALALAPLGPALAACRPPVAGRAGREAGPAGPRLPAEAVTLRLWHWDDFLIEPYTKEGEAFTQKFPTLTVTVEHTPAGEYPTKLLAAIAGGVPPDVVGVTVTRADFLTFAAKGVLTPLQPLIQRDRFDLEDFYPLNLKQHTWKGTLYSLPYAWNTVVWFYNADLFAREGAKTPAEFWREGRWTWETYLELTLRLTRGAGADKQFGSAVVSPTFTAAFLPLVWTNGGELFTPYGRGDSTPPLRPALLDPPTFGAFQFAYDVRRGAPTAEEARTATVASGRIGMWPNWDLRYQVDLPVFPFRFSLVPPPASPRTGLHYFTGNAPGFGIPQGAKYPDASWELLTHLLSPEALTRVYLATNNTPSRRSLVAGKELWQKNTALPDPELMWTIAKAKEKAAKNPPKISTWFEMTRVLAQEMNAVWNDQQDLKTGVQNVVQQWEVLLKDAEVDPDLG